MHADPLFWQEHGRAHGKDSAAWILNALCAVYLRPPASSPLGQALQLLELATSSKFAAGSLFVTDMAQKQRHHQPRIASHENHKNPT